MTSRLMTQVAPASLSVMTARELGSSRAVTGNPRRRFRASSTRNVGLAFDAEPPRRNGGNCGTS